MSEPVPQGVLSEACRVLLSAIEQLAEERDDVRRALSVASSWIDATLANGSSRDGHPGVVQKVVTPGGDRRVVSMRPFDAHEDERRARERRPCDLRMVVRRAQWKAEACRWAVERRLLEQRNADHGTEIRPRDEALRARREELEDCYAWMLDPYRTLPDDTRMAQIAACYDNAALAAECTMRLIADGAMEPAPPAELLYQIAEVQSALLASIAAVDLRGDSDQRDLFQWLKTQTLRHRIYVDRHMKLDDPADFTVALALAKRLLATTDAILDRWRVQRRRSHILNKIRFHIGKMRTEGSPERDLESIGRGIDEWIELGFLPNDRSLGALVEPLESVGKLPESVRRVVAAYRLGAADPPEERALDDSRRVQFIGRARELMEGMTVSLFAGHEEPKTIEELVDQLGLDEVRWTELGAEPSIEDLREDIEDAQVDLVMIAARLPVDTYAEFKSLCREHETPFVRLPAGYAPGQVAQQVVRQVGRMLRVRAQV